MLQQTTVAAVIGYFDRFVTKFPTLVSLAAAEEADVLLLWQGLGYYSRARNLHRAAKILVNEHNGKFPEDPEIFSKLPGIGRYMLGAILSQAFEQRLPIVEANTRRVYVRLLSRFDLDLDSREGQVWLWQTATDLLPRKRIGDFNQALMELGATLCRPQPLCEECPVSKECLAYQSGLQDQLPLSRKKKEFEQVQTVTLVIEDQGKFLLRQIGPGGRWARLWEFPQRTIEPEETEAEACRKLLEELGIRAQIGKEITQIRYGVTRFKIQMTALEAELTGRAIAREDFRWLLPGEWADHPLSTPMRKLAEILRNPRQLRLF